MSEPREVPTALNIVAVLFLIAGIGSAIEIVFSLLNGTIDFNFGVLGIPLFYRLRAFSAPWRTFALWLLATGAVVSAFGAVLVPLLPGQVDLGLFGLKILRNVSHIWFTAAAVPVFFLIAWELAVLLRSDIRARFETSSQ